MQGPRYEAIRRCREDDRYRVRQDAPDIFMDSSCLRLTEPKRALYWVQ